MAPSAENAFKPCKESLVLFGLSLFCLHRDRSFFFLGGLSCFSGFFESFVYQVLLGAERIFAVLDLLEGTVALYYPGFRVIPEAGVYDVMDAAAYGRIVDRAGDFDTALRIPCHEIG